MSARAYYNEVEPYAAQWLRNLIAAGLIPAGDVDERSIVDVRADDLAGYVQCHFFAGIGGWAHAARLAGWPDDRPLWTGSCPCQPFSVAGAGKGQADERHLWPVFAGLIRECRPPVVAGEQVAAAIGKHWLDGVCSDLEAIGYACGAVVVPACAVDAPHRRDRLWFVADAAGSRQCDAEDAGAACGCARASTGQAWPAAGLLESERGGGACAVADAGGRCVRDSGCAEAAGAAREVRGEVREQRLRADARADDRGVDVGDASAQGSPLPECEAIRCPGRGQEGRAVAEPSRSPWSAAGWLTGADGKARRVEPGIRLLAHGVPARVGRLRAYGNAIVPQVAAEILGALMIAAE